MKATFLLAVLAVAGLAAGPYEAPRASTQQVRTTQYAVRSAVTRYVRYSHRGRISYGILDGETIRELRGDLFASPQPTGVTARRSEVKLLIPLDPARVSKVVGVAINTRRPGLEAPVPHPRWFAKFPTSLNDAEGDVEMPPEATNLNYEGELVVVIGKRARHVPEAEALNYVFGYTVGNDFSENTWYGERQGVNEPTRLLSKGMDTWAPIGSTIVAGIEHRGLPVRTKLNGELVQEGTTNDLVNDVPKLISHLSRYVTLLPGDVIFTGTVRVLPDKRRRMQPGDVVEVEIEGLGTTRNRIVEMKTP
jgi:2-keto-4-pentenoate hydratase/2-oxohepta-3-ene-1,7-dioic acid hydratase in catechol pathway